MKKQPGASNQIKSARRTTFIKAQVLLFAVYKTKPHTDDSSWPETCHSNAKGALPHYETLRILN